MPMNIKELFEIVNIETLDNKVIGKIKNDKGILSKGDKKFLVKIMSSFKNQDINKTLKAIILYAIWFPDDSIEQARKKGIFRYGAYGFQENKVKYIIKTLSSLYNTLKFSDKTLEFFNSKLNLDWLYDFYKKTEEDLIKYIKRHHRNRNKIIKENIIFEEALFKELLVFIDTLFSGEWNSGYGYGHDFNRNKFYSYSIIHSQSEEKKRFKNEHLSRKIGHSDFVLL